MFWNGNKPPKASSLTWRECFGLLVPAAGVLTFIVGWCYLMLESGNARYFQQSDYLPPPQFTRFSASVFSLWLLAGTCITVFGLLIARKQFTLFVLIIIALMAGASGSLPFLFLKQ